MLMKQILILYCLFLCQCLFSQTILKGKVVSDTPNLDPLIVINTTQNKSTETLKDGLFSIIAKPLDTLQFSGVQIKGIKIVLKPEDFSKGLLIVPLKSKIILLDEVLIKDNNKIDAVSQGILNKPAKKYTVAERRLHEATSGSGLVPLNPILNAITGRTKMLKKGIEVEKKERLINRLSGYYEDVFYIEQLKIPQDYIKGFQVYVVDDKNIISSLNNKNKTLTAFWLSELAPKYLTVISAESN
jgi:hypothetical protein